MIQPRETKAAGGSPQRASEPSKPGRRLERICTRRRELPLWLTLAATCSACSISYHARGPDKYREDTRALLESRESSFRGCYEELLEGSPEASGSVAVSFEVEEETGKITAAKSLEESTAPPELQQCVVRGLEGLALEPPDERKGVATMTFEFSRG